MSPSLKDFRKIVPGPFVEGDILVEEENSNTRYYEITGFGSEKGNKSKRRVSMVKLREITEAEIRKTEYSVRQDADLWEDFILKKHMISTTTSKER